MLLNLIEDVFNLISWVQSGEIVHFCSPSEKLLFVSIFLSHGMMFVRRRNTYLIVNEDVMA
jgi:hypothetical protein